MPYVFMGDKYVGSLEDGPGNRPTPHRLFHNVLSIPRVFLSSELFSRKVHDLRVTTFVGCCCRARAGCAADDR
eukprot:34302-Pyramimonas_sp.AAC.1